MHTFAVYRNRASVATLLLWKGLMHNVHLLLREVSDILLRPRSMLRHSRVECQLHRHPEWVTSDVLRNGRHTACGRLQRNLWRTSDRRLFRTLSAWCDLICFVLLKMLFHSRGRPPAFAVRAADISCPRPSKSSHASSPFTSLLPVMRLAALSSTLSPTCIVLLDKVLGESTGNGRFPGQL